MREIPLLAVQDLTRIRSVVFATLITLALAACLTWLSTSAVTRMRNSTNEIDDRRAVSAARSALNGLQAKLLTTVHDNATWDEAYDAMTSPEREAWIHDNWGRTSADYPLYDGIVVTDQDGGVISAYWQGSVFDPVSKFGINFMHRVSEIRKPDAELIGFARTELGLLLVGGQVIKPFSMRPARDAHETALFLKALSPTMIASMANEHQIQNLAVAENVSGDNLTVQITDLFGKVVAYLTWPSERPGDIVFSEVRPSLALGGCVLGIFVLSILFFGNREAKKLRTLAAASDYQATHDSLTALFNRQGFIRQLEGITRHSANNPSCVFVLDLDGFKLVNDAWGRAVGDRLLKVVAKRLATAHPEVAVMGRIGGDSFGLIQIGPTSPQAFSLSLASVFETPFAIDGRTIELGVSMGASSVEANETGLELLRRSDLAVARAKESGRRKCVVYTEALEQDRIARNQLEAELRQAIVEDAIDVAFQPLVCSQTGKISGAEALARWRGPRGPIAPDIFISLAEKSGLIDQLGMQVLQKAVRNASRWSTLTISVNVSPVQLCNPAFAAEVLQTLEAEGLDPARLVLEITEGVLMSNPEQAKRAIDALRQSGIRFALDDFGCGYASIGALREFGFDRLKIDRSLVVAVDKQPNGLDVLKATISLAHALAIPVTAEGVETGDQAKILREAGCDLLQGYLIGKPMPAEELSKLASMPNAA